MKPFLWPALLVISLLLVAGCLPTPPSIRLSPLSVLMAAQKGTSKAEVKKSLGSPHYGSEESPLWEYVYQDKNKNYLRLDIMYDRDDKVMLSTLKPCQQVRTGGQMERRCMVRGETYKGRVIDF